MQWNLVRLFSGGLLFFHGLSSLLLVGSTSFTYLQGSRASPQLFGLLFSSLALDGRIDFVLSEGWCAPARELLLLPSQAVNAERLRQRSGQFSSLHRQCVQLQAKAKVWTAQADAKEQRATELQKKVQSLQERIAARKKEILDKQQKIDEVSTKKETQSMLLTEHREEVGGGDSVGRPSLAGSCVAA